MQVKHMMGRAIQESQASGVVANKLCCISAWPHCSCDEGLHAKAHDVKK